MDIESTLNSMLLFSTVKNGQFDYTTPLKSSLINFDTDKKIEPSPLLFEYLCYKLVKKKLMEGKANTETILITENFLISLNRQKIILNTSVIHKKHIIIFLQSIKTQKWNLIAFLNLEQQLKDSFEQNSKKPIIAKIISSNSNSEEDDYILNTTMDKLENTFNFRSPDDIQFEVDSINISDQPNISIFLLNFLDGLIEQNDADMISYIQKLYIEGSNNLNENCIEYFSPFNEVKEDFLNLYFKYQNELKEYIKNNPKLEVEKIMNGNDEILNIDNNNTGYIVGENEALANGMSKTNIKSEKNDDIDMIQIEKDDDIDEDDINSDEEEEALKIMEKESLEAKTQIMNQKRKLNQRLYQQKLRLKNIDMYREFGVIKEEDNESESESIDIFNKMKEEAKAKKIINDSRKLRKNKDNKLNKENKKINGIENEKNNVLKTEIDTHGSKEISKEEVQNKNNYNSEKKSKSDKGIKLSVLKELEQAIEEFELEQEPSSKSIENKTTNSNNIFEDLKIINKNNKISNTESNNNNNEIKNNNEKKNNTLIVNENKEKENVINKKNSEKIMNNSDMNKTGRKSAHIRNSISEKKGSINLNINTKSLIPAIKQKDKENFKIIKNSKSVTKKVKSDKEKEKEKEKENNNDSSKNKEQSNEIKITKTNKSSNSNKAKEKDSNSTNYNSPIIYNTNSFQSFNSNSNSNKSNNDTEKHSKEKDNKKGRRTEPMDNLSKKISNAKVVFNNVKKKNSKINPKYKKTKNNSEYNSQILPAISIMSLIDGTYKSSISKIEEPPRSQRNSNKNRHPKALEKKNNKNKKVLSPIESPMNVLPPQKIVERNGLNGLQTINKNEKSNLSLSPKYKIFNLHSVQSEKNNGDFNSNINIENILSDEFEYEKEKNEFIEEGSLAVDNRTKKTMVKRGDKKMKSKIPPGKTKISNKTHSEQYCSYNEEGANKACGCIGEQANQLCMIF